MNPSVMWLETVTFVAVCGWIRSTCFCTNSLVLHHRCALIVLCVGTLAFSCRSCLVTPLANYMLRMPLCTSPLIQNVEILREF